jgi:RNA polymerase sigma factor (sigma-70 family)
MRNAFHSEILEPGCWTLPHPLKDFIMSYKFLDDILGSKKCSNLKKRYGEDAYQDAIVSIILKLEVDATHYDKVLNFETYFHSIVKLKEIDTQNQKKELYLDDLSFFEDIDTECEDCPDEKIEQKAIKQTINKIPRNRNDYYCREILRLVMLNDGSITKTSKQLNIKTDSIYNCVKKLKPELNKNYNKLC